MYESIKRLPSNTQWAVDQLKTKKQCPRFVPNIQICCDEDVLKVCSISVSNPVLFTSKEALLQGVLTKFKRFSFYLSLFFLFSSYNSATYLKRLKTLGGVVCIKCLPKYSSICFLNRLGCFNQKWHCDSTTDGLSRDHSALLLQQR